MDCSSKFELPKSALDQPINSSSTDHVGDGGELVLCLSIFGFSQLSVTDQDERTKEIHNKVGEDVTEEQLPEETEDGSRNSPSLTRLFSFLQLYKKFMNERRFEELIFGFKTQLDANDQQQLIGQVLDHFTVGNIQKTPEQTGDFIIRTFTELARDHADHIYTHPAWEDNKRFKNTYKEEKRCQTS
ncbi:hypothetical protein L3X38_039234 [Prunus dulcis]|uniref:Uncharacterized protein n=1 Tax=Prunus dulcis TaxID=3755 RepID=A0AAD4V7Y8_PRUDU|nr:hypothetical protein L3X38_039234 [Prunus dulcis]